MSWIIKDNKDRARSTKDELLVGANGLLGGWGGVGVGVGGG